MGMPQSRKCCDKTQAPRITFRHTTQREEQIDGGANNKNKNSCTLACGRTCDTLSASCSTCNDVDSLSPFPRIGTTCTAHARTRQFRNKPFQIKFSHTGDNTATKRRRPPHEITTATTNALPPCFLRVEHKALTAPQVAPVRLPTLSNQLKSRTGKKKGKQEKNKGHRHQSHAATLTHRPPQQAHQRTNSAHIRSTQLLHQTIITSTCQHSSHWAGGVRFLHFQLECSVAVVILVTQSHQARCNMRVQSSKSSTTQHRRKSSDQHSNVPSPARGFHPM